MTPKLPQRPAPCRGCQETIMSQTPKQMDAYLTRVHAQAPALIEALRHALWGLDNLTSDEFARGEDKAIREKLRAILRAVEEK